MGVLFLILVGSRATSLKVVLSLKSFVIAAKDRGILLVAVLHPQKMDRVVGRCRQTNRLGLYSQLHPPPPPHKSAGSFRGFVKLKSVVEGESATVVLNILLLIRVALF